MRANDLIKDQSFFLCHLNQSVLPFIEFPIGHMMKNDVKSLAKEMNLERIAQKSESNLKRIVFIKIFIFQRYGFMFYW